MRYLMAVIWLCVAATWALPIRSLCKVIGGCKWIEHMGQAGSVTTTAVMLSLCLAAAASYVISGRVSKVVSIPIIVGALVYLIKAAGFFLQMSNNGHVSPVVMLPFRVIGQIVPTILVTGNLETMLALYVALPAVCLLLAAFAIFSKAAHVSRSAGA